MRFLLLTSIVFYLSSNQTFADTVTCRSLIEMFSKADPDLIHPKKIHKSDLFRNAVEAFVRERVKAEPNKLSVRTLMREISLEALILETEQKGFPDPNLKDLFTRLQEAGIYTVTSSGLHNSNLRIPELLQFLHETVIYMSGRGEIHFDLGFKMVWTGQ